MISTFEKEGYKEFEHYSIWMEGGNIHTACKPDIIITIDIANHMVAEREKLAKGMKRTILADVRNILSIEGEARKFFASREANHLVRARAILHNHILIYLAAKVFILADRPPAPTQVFYDKNFALRWLEIFKYN